MNEIQQYFPQLSAEQVRQLSMLESLYTDWNAKINEISRKDIESLYIKHVLHSLAIAKVQPFERSSTVMEVETGGGFARIPHAIMFPETQFYLKETIGKNIKVVQEVITALRLKNAKA